MTCLMRISVMLKILFLLFSALMMTECQQNAKSEPDYPIRPVPFTEVKVTDNFWSKRLLTNHLVTIPIAFRKAAETGRIDNFRIAGGIKEGSFCSLYPFDDSDVYKNIEAACYSIQLYPDRRMELYLDTLIGYIAAAQEKDGYLYTNRTIDPLHTHEMAGTERWEKVESGSHELYNVGHMYEAAVAHYQATGKRTLLNIAIKNANLIDSLFGWGKIEKAPGHQEIEIGLVKLYRVTGDKRYLDLAKFFLDVRGPNGQDYNQMHQKATEQRTAVGHAVRAQYMYAAMADIAALSGEQKYLEAIDTLWNDVVGSKTYITGGIGAKRDIEGFGPPYFLPNAGAYCETCASIANALWNYRMFLLHGDSKYFDVFEKVLYNGLLSGVSLSGDYFFYTNPLASEGEYVRKAWFGCACCPVNITRFLPSLPGYVYSTRGDELFINLFIGNEARINMEEFSAGLTMITGYPWDGTVRLKITIDQPRTFTMRLRVPGWARNEAFPSGLYYFKNEEAETPNLAVNGTSTGIQLSDGYLSIRRNWESGDEITLDLPMQVREVKANSLVSEDIGMAALQRGPVMYCLEADEEYPDIRIALPEKGTIGFKYQPEMLEGTGTLEGPNFRAIPYYAWANRDPESMAVWIPDTSEME